MSIVYKPFTVTCITASDDERGMGVVETVVLGAEPMRILASRVRI